MNKNNSDINDNEIRIISSDSNTNISTSGSRHKKNILIWLGITIFVITIGAFLYSFLKSDSRNGDEDSFVIMENVDNKKTSANAAVSSTTKKGYVEITDTKINNIQLSIFTPRFAVAKLQIGIEALQDTAAVFVIQAADVRKDNGEIVGTYVSKGNLISKGHSKSGFCAIIGGTPIVGVSDKTPYLEQAIETNGYFFRQYPLVVGGQLVENKPKGKSIRKAIAEWNDEIVVVMSKNRLTFHEFAQVLVEMGVSNAIYLVGSSTFGFAVDSVGNRIEFGQKETDISNNTNYIVWK